MINKILLSFVVGLVVLVILLVIMAIIFPEYFGAARESTEPPGIVRMQNAFVDFPNARNVAGAWEYEVMIEGEVFYDGEMKVRDISVTFITAFALISFKGEDKKATVITENGEEETFIINEVDRITLKRFRTSVVSVSPPLEDVPNPYFGEMKKSQSFHLTDAGDYIVNLRNIRSPPVYYTPGFGDPLNPDCAIEFGISCPKTSHSITIVDGECNQGSKPSCQDEAKICGGEVFIKVYDSNCAEGFVDSLTIKVTGGEKMDIGDSAEISFWIYDQCTRDKITFGELRRECGGSFLGGPYSFKGERIPFS